MTQEEEQLGITLEMFQSYVMTQLKQSEIAPFPIARKGCRPGKSSCLWVSSKQSGPSSLQLCCLLVSGVQPEALKRVQFPAH